VSMFIDLENSNVKWLKEMCCMGGNSKGNNAKFLTFLLELEGSMTIMPVEK